MKKFVSGFLAGAILCSAGSLMASGNIRLVINGQDITNTLDVSPQIINGRTMVPLRIVSERLDASVDWNSANQTITITSNYSILPGSSSPDYLAPLGYAENLTAAELLKKYRRELDVLGYNIINDTVTSSAGLVQPCIAVVEKNTGNKVYTFNTTDMPIPYWGTVNDNNFRSYLREELSKLGYI